MSDKSCPLQVQLDCTLVHSSSQLACHNPHTDRQMDRLRTGRSVIRSQKIPVLSLLCKCTVGGVLLNADVDTKNPSKNVSQHTFHLVK